MAAYIRGNLAVEERESRPRNVQMKETRKVVYRTSRLPVQEKLLYLFAVLICVLVAGTVLWRYAQMYQMNNEIRKEEKTISQLEAQNDAMKEKLSKMMNPDLMNKEAVQAGLIPITDANFVRVPAQPKTQSEGLAVKP